MKFGPFGGAHRQSEWLPIEIVRVVREVVGPDVICALRPMIHDRFTATHAILIGHMLEEL